MNLASHNAVLGNTAGIASKAGPIDGNPAWGSSVLRSDDLWAGTENAPWPLAVSPAEVAQGTQLPSFPQAKHQLSSLCHALACSLHVGRTSWVLHRVSPCLVRHHSGIKPAQSIMPQDKNDMLAPSFQPASGQGCW